MPASNRRIYRFSEWALDPAERLLTRNGLPVPLTPKVFETLLLLIENAGRLVTKLEFMKRVWPDAFVEDLALAQNISLVRKVLKGSGAMIETVPKRGYRFTADVRAVEELPAADFESSDLIANPEAEGGRVRNPSASSGQALLVPSTPATLSAKEQIVHPRASVSGRNDTVEVASAGVRNDMPLEDVQIPAAITPAKKMAWAIAALLVIAASLVALIWTRTHHDVSAEISPAPVIVPLLDISGEERMPALSADGSRIAFLRHALEPGKSGIYAEVVGNQSLLQLSTGGSDSHPVWSPDGRYVAFLRESGEAGMDGRPYTFSIIVVPSLGGAERQLYTGNQVPVEGPVSISFSSDSRQIAFAEWDAAAQQSSIKVISLADSTVHAVTSPPFGIPRRRACVFAGWHRDCLCSLHWPDLRGRHLCRARAWRRAEASHLRSSAPI